MILKCAAFSNMDCLVLKNLLCDTEDQATYDY